MEYFAKEQVQDALRDIGEPTTDTKEGLVNNLAANWQSYNRDNYELLDFLDGDALQMICYHYNLDASDATEDTYIRRIRKAELLEGSSSKKITRTETPRPPASEFSRPQISDDYPESPPRKNFHEDDDKSPKHGPNYSKIIAILTAVGVTVAIITLVLGQNDQHNPITNSSDTIQNNAPSHAASVNQSGGITANQVIINNPTINNAPPQRHVTPEIIDYLNANLPANKNETILVSSMEGDPEGFQFSNEIVNYLQTNGWKVQADIAGGEPLYDTGLHVDNSTGVTHIWIGFNR
ncbi:MAG: hypothetical protein ACREBB_10045 [Nitrosotalea sp.]